MNALTPLKIPQGSPKIHPRRVKLGKRVKALNIKENNNSLFMFHLFTHTPAHDARPRVFARVRVRVGEKVKLQNRYLAAQEPPDGGGNSSEHRQSLFSVSACSVQPTTHEEMRP
jgi:hypothetical protein